MGGAGEVVCVGCVCVCREREIDRRQTDRSIDLVGPFQTPLRQHLGLLGTILDDRMHVPRPFLLSTGRDETELPAVYLCCIALLKSTVLPVAVLGAALFLF